MVDPESSSPGTQLRTKKAPDTQQYVMSNSLTGEEKKALHRLFTQNPRSGAHLCSEGSCPSLPLSLARRARDLQMCAPVLLVTEVLFLFETPHSSCPSR